MTNRICYTWVWLRNDRPVPYGETFACLASKRQRRKVLKEARRRHYHVGR